MYTHDPSFTDLLPWTEWLADEQCVLLEDGVSVGAVFEVQAIGTEARPISYMEDVRDRLQIALAGAIPHDETSPWVLQIFVQDDPGLQKHAQQVGQYGASDVRNSQYGESFHRDYCNHLTRISQDGGLFKDTLVSGSVWRGQIRRVRAVLYQRQQAKSRAMSLDASTKALNEVATRWTASMKGAGLNVRRCCGLDIYEWWLEWFNPRPVGPSGQSVTAIEAAPYPGDRDLPFGYDFAECLTFRPPESDAERGVWWFDDMPHSIVSVQGLRTIPRIGHVSAEHAHGDHQFALLDRMPEGTVMALTVTIRPQDLVRNHIARVKRAAVGDSADAVLTREDAEAVEREIVQGNGLYPAMLAFFVRGTDVDDLEQNGNMVRALLLANGIQPIAKESDLSALDSYIRNLPMVHDPQLRNSQYRSRLTFSKHIANLVPVYGRSRGTGNSGVVFFNRGAEPFEFDPLNATDRKKNAHSLILGPTGAGKSALLVYLLQQMVARYRPRVFIIEAGGSFSLLGQHFASEGITVNQVSLHPGKDVSLPPFVGAHSLLEEKEGESSSVSTVDDDGLDRDLLGEMEIAARIMITGGEPKEDERLTRSDRLLIRQAIIHAAEATRSDGKDTVLTEDVAEALRHTGRNPELPEGRRLRAMEMADGLALFCSGIAGHFFNRPGTTWPDVDVTILEMGLLAREGYADQLTVAYLSIMNHINDLVERNQHSQRPTLVVTDEGHIITTHPLLASYVVKITKMWRKLGAWFWIATQNLADFPDASRKMLGMMEWWICLTTPKEEVDEIARFRELTDTQRRLLLSARKEPGKYVEGVVLSDNVEALFRNVPPPLSLALAMTEKQEKAQRAEIMESRGCTELEAVHVVANELAQRRMST